MGRNPSLPLNAIFFVICVCISLNSIVFSAPPEIIPLRVETVNQQTVINFQLPRSWDAKLLSTSPARQVILKIFPTQETNVRLIAQPVNPPEHSGLLNFKAIPTTSRGTLFVFNFSDELAFQWQSSPVCRIILNDRFLHDPLEIEFRQGLALHKKGRLREALQAYRKVVFRNRRHGNAYYKAAQIRFALGQNRLAEINFKHALRLECDSLNLYRDVADFYQKTGRPALAAKYEKEFRKRQPAEGRPQLAEQSKPVVSSQIQKETVTPTDSAAAATFPAVSHVPALRSVPGKIVFYLVGIVLLAGVISVSVWMIVSQKRTDRFKQEQAALFVPSLQHKEKMIQLARQIAQQEKNPEPVPAPVLAAGKTEPEHSYHPEPDERNAPETIARNLNLGVGEIELALNLKSQQRRYRRVDTLERQIEKLVSLNHGVADIARELNLGQGEVELYMNLRSSEQSQPELL